MSMMELQGSINGTSTFVYKNDLPPWRNLVFKMLMYMCRYADLSKPIIYHFCCIDI